MECARNAVTECLACRDNDAWKQTVHAWEKLDREAAESITDVERRADPDNWPVAGAAGHDADLALQPSRHQLPPVA